LQRTLYENGEMELGKKYEDAYNRLVASLQVTGAIDRNQY
jgi:hypothetical protein